MMVLHVECASALGNIATLLGLALEEMSHTFSTTGSDSVWPIIAAAVRLLWSPLSKSHIPEFV